MSTSSGPPGLDREALLGSVTFRAEPIRLSPLYQAGVLVAAVAMVVLPLIYLALVALVAAAVVFHATFNWWIIGGGLVAALVGYVTPLFAGSLGLLFMVKPLFAPPPQRTTPRVVTEEDEPFLHAYVDALCTSLGAPKPTRIEADLQVNASARLTGGLMGIGRGDLVLTIGLPFTAGLDVAQWTGVLAHEFGHFTQGGAMRLMHVIGTVNHWFVRVVFERDGWDERLERWVVESDNFWAQLVLLLSRAFIWVSRRVLWGLMMVGLGVSAFLSRQMEYNADRHQAQVTGSDAFEGTHLQARLLDAAWAQATAYLNHMWTERRLVDDVCALTVLEAHRLTDDEEAMKFLSDAMAQEETRWLHTHPSTPDRVRAVQALALPARVDATPPASRAFDGFDELSRALSADLYEMVLGEAIDPDTLVPVWEVLDEQENRLAGRRALDALCGYTPLATLGVFPRAADLAESRLLGRDLASAHRALTESAPEVRSFVQRLDEVVHRQRGAILGLRAAGAGIEVKAETIGLSPEEMADLAKLASESREARTAIREELRPHQDRLIERLMAGLVLAERPDVAVDLTSPPDRARVERLLAVLESFEDCWDTMRTASHDIMASDFIAHFAHESKTPGLVEPEIIPIWEGLRDAVTKIRDAIGAHPYPYEHNEDAASVLDYLGNTRPEEGPEVGTLAQETLSRAGDLYFRVWGELSEIVLAVEVAIGLPPPPPPPSPESADSPPT